jgi:hypothetical protein
MKKIIAVLVFAALSWGAVTQITTEYYIVNSMSELSEEWPENTIGRVLDSNKYYIHKTSGFMEVVFKPILTTTSSGGGAMVSHGNEYHTSSFTTNTYHDGLKRDTSAHDTTGLGAKVNGDDAEYLDALAKRHDGSAQNTAIAGKCDNSDSRLSDARTPVSHNNTYHSATYITQSNAEPPLGNPSVTGHVLSSTTGGVRSWVAQGGGGATWGSITGTLSNQTDLNTALTDKATTGAVTGCGITMSTATLLGRTTASTGAIEQITIGSGLTLSAGSLTATGGGGGLGYCVNVRAASQATTTDGQTLYWGGMLVAPSTTANRWRVYFPKAGTIKAAYIYSYSGTAGSAEAWVMNICKNNTTDYQIASITLATVDRVWSNTGLSISVVAGDYIEIKEVQPTWSTNPATVTRTGNIYIE